MAAGAGARVRGAGVVAKRTWAEHQELGGWDYWDNIGIYWENVGRILQDGAPKIA